MSKGFGVAAFVFAIIGTFLPFGYFLSGISGLLAILSYGNGFVFGFSSIIINIINISILSPTLMLMVNSTNPNSQMAENMLVGLIFCQVIPLIVFLIRWLKNR